MPWMRQVANLCCGYILERVAPTPPALNSTDDGGSAAPASGVAEGAS